LLPFFDLAATCAALVWCALLPAPALPRRGGRRRWTAARAAALCGLVGLAGCALATLWIGWPLPGAHDEFAYLLHADTFARGRLTNPAHPFWPHFENLYILQQPTYTAKYHPAQGLVLATGQLVGHPAVGVWLSCAAMGAALAWMLAGWTSPRWALVGGLLAMLRLAVGSYWGHSYWGGAVAATGGALVFGALGRLRRGPRLGPALALAAGLALLALSRPFEGALVALPVAAALAVLAWRGRRLGPWLRRVALPVALALAALAAWAGYYNWRTTGDPAEHPYVLHERLYEPAPFFVWQRERPMPAYRHQILHDHYLGSLEHYRAQRNPRGYLRKLVGFSLPYLWSFFLGGLLTLPLLALPWALRDGWTRFHAATLLLGAAGVLSIKFVTPHYAAPLVAPGLLVYVRCLRQARLYAPRGRPVGRRLAALMLPGTAVLLLAQLADLRGAHRSDWSHLRIAVAERLRAEPGSDLVLVRFAPRALDPGWTYNGADLERDPIVWARQMSAAEDCALAAHYTGRKLWDLEVVEGISAPRLRAYGRCGPALAPAATELSRRSP
jgi:hypothetical protein